MHIHLSDATTRRRDDRLDECFALVEAARNDPHPAPVDQLEHALQTATRALRAGAGHDLILAALMHDIGRPIDRDGHGPAAAALLEPLVPPHIVAIVAAHEVFSWRHVPREYGLDPDARDRFRGEAWFDAAEIFVDQWDRFAFSRGECGLPLVFFNGFFRARRS